jgi:hypothetical protein
MRRDAPNAVVGCTLNLVIRGIDFGSEVVRTRKCRCRFFLIEVYCRRPCVLCNSVKLWTPLIEGLLTAVGTACRFPRPVINLLNPEFGRPCPPPLAGWSRVVWRCVPVGS